MTEATQGFRGTIIKVPGNEPRPILANGKQRPFGVEGVWASPVSGFARYRNQCAAALQAV